MPRKKQESKSVPKEKKSAPKEKTKSVPIEKGKSVEQKDLHEIRIDYLPTELIFEAKINPNVQSEAVFQKLVDSIKEGGFDEPILVVPSKEQIGFYEIASGNHRFRALKDMGRKTIPSIVKNWDEFRKKIEIVRRNIVRGTIDEGKFTKLVDQLIKEEDTSIETVSDLMGFTQFGDFAQLYEITPSEVSEREIKEIEEVSKMVEKAESDISHHENLEIIISMLLRDYPETLEDDFMYFMFRKKMHAYVRLNKKGRSAVDMLMNFMKDKIVEGRKGGAGGEDINEFLEKAITNELKNCGVDISEYEKICEKRKQKNSKGNMEIGVEF